METPKETDETTRETSPAPAAEGSLAERLDALHARRFVGTRLANDTELWNMVHAFKEDVKRLVAEIEAL